MTQNYKTLGKLMKKYGAENFYSFSFTRFYVKLQGNFKDDLYMTLWGDKISDVERWESEGKIYHTFKIKNTIKFNDIEIEIVLVE